MLYNYSFKVLTFPSEKLKRNQKSHPGGWWKPRIKIQVHWLCLFSCSEPITYPRTLQPRLQSCQLWALWAFWVSLFFLSEGLDLECLAECAKNSPGNSLHLGSMGTVSRKVCCCTSSQAAKTVSYNTSRIRFEVSYFLSQLLVHS